MSKRIKPVFLPEEKKSILSLSAILFTRMLGLFLILPVFSLLAHEGLTGATPFLVGVAMGGYGLTSAIFQIPFGFWSDRFGRFSLFEDLDTSVSWSYYEHGSHCIPPVVFYHKFHIPLP